MDLENEVAELKEAKKRNFKVPREMSFRLTERDVLILGFLLDQKFASLEQLYFRFFDVRKDVKELLPPGLHVTRQRLALLRRAGLISTAKVFTEAKSLYLLTGRGFEVFQSKKPDEAFAHPMRTVDFRNYEHDTKVNDCRIAIERTGRVMRWIPDRQIRMEGFKSKYSWSRLPKEVVPDGIFISKEGKRIAFEIETSSRAKERYKDKCRSYQGVMFGDDPLFSRVIWVGLTDRIQATLKDVVQNRERFSVESYSHFLSKLWPTGVAEKISQ